MVLLFDYFWLQMKVIFSIEQSKKSMYKITLVLFLMACGIKASLASDSLVVAANEIPKSVVIVEQSIKEEQPDYVKMAKDDVKKFYSNKKPMWTGLVCGFTPVVGWIAAPIIGASVKLKEEQLQNIKNNHNYLLTENPVYQVTFMKAAKAKRRNGFIIGFGIGISILAGYYLATQPEYK